MSLDFLLHYTVFIFIGLSLMHSLIYVAIKEKSNKKYAILSILGLILSYSSLIFKGPIQ